MNSHLSQQEAADQIRTQLEKLPPKKGFLYVDGPAGAGKTKLLIDFANGTQKTSVLDAAGRSASELADDMMQAIGVAYADSRSIYDLGGLAKDQKLSPRIIVVCNTQWAGKTRSTIEPRKAAAGGIIGELALKSKAVGLKFVIEVDSEVYDLGPRNRNPIRLTPDPDIIHPSLDSLTPRQRTTLTALALSEPQRVRFEEWRALCSALGADVEVAELRTICEESGLVSVDIASDLPVGFVHERDARTLRRMVPADAFQAFQVAVVDRLFASPDDDPLRGYLTRALPAHAAMAGRLEELLADPRTLVKCAHTALLDALRVAFPDSIPAGSFAADLYYLDNLGLAPSSHAEWIALLHLVAMSQGDEERARALTEATGPLPWRTVWTHWRPPGVLRPLPPQIKAVESLHAHPDRASVSSVTLDRLQQTWHATTGQLLGATPPFLGAKGPFIESAPPTPPSPTRWRAEHSQNLIRLSSPGDPSASRVVQAPQVWDVACVGNVVVLGGSRGIYAIEPDPDYTETSPLPTLPAIRWHATITPRPYDEAACRPTRALMLDVFDADIAPLLTEEQLPSGLTHEPTRRFLTDVGFPSVSNFLSLHTHNLAGSGLVEHTWQGTKEFETPVGDGPFYELGRWIGGVLLLDGPTGRVLRQSTKGAVDDARPGDPLAGSSLAQFAAMVCLQWKYMFAHDTSGTPLTSVDGEDLITELRAWLAGIDPAAAATRNWGHVTDSEEFVYL